jgi:hypothetical protein
MSQVVPFTVPASGVSSDLRRAAAYRVGHPVTDQEAQHLIDWAIEDLLAQWMALGRWIARIDALTPREAGLRCPARPALSGVAKNNPGARELADRSAAMKRVWAAKRARGERLPATAQAPSREFGQRAAWRTREQKGHQATAQRAAWARRKAQEA